MDEPITPQPKRPRRPWLVWSGMGLLVALAAGAGWWFSGNRVWTDGRAGPDAIRVSASVEAPRQVLWSPPTTLAGAFNSTAQEYEPAVSPDGTEVYFVRGKAGLPTTAQPATAATQPATTQSTQPTQASTVSTTQPAVQPASSLALTNGADLYVSYRRENAWTEPVPLAAANSHYDDLGPRISADGKFLVFYSNRPGGVGGYDIWACTRVPGGWGTPFNLGSPVNSEFDEYNPAPTPDGKRLFFSTNRTAAQKEQREAWRATIRAASTGDFDLWLADVATASPATRPTGTSESRLVATNAREAVGLNTPFHEGASCLSPGGEFLYFASNRSGGAGKFDLYRARILQAGTPDEMIEQPENLGPTINTADNETDPQLAHGGFKLLFSSDRQLPTPAANESAAPPVSPDTASPSSTTRPLVPLSDVPPDAASLAAASGTGYDLYESDSREVFPERQARAVPAISRNTWLLIGSALLLIPLLLFMSKFDRRKLSILQRCLLAAILIHIALLFSLTLVTAVMPPGSGGFGRDILASIGLADVPVDLDGGAAGAAQSDIAMSVRQQSTSDLPSVPAAPVGQAIRQSVGSEIVAAPDLPMNVPQASTGREPITVLVTPPRPDLPVPPPAANVAPVPVQAPRIGPQVSSVDIKLNTGERLAQAEQAAIVTPMQAPQASAAPALPQPVIRPPSVVGPQLPPTLPQTSAGTLAEAVGAVRPNVPSVPFPAVGQMMPQATNDVARPAMVDVAQPTGPKLTGTEPTRNVPVNGATSVSADRIETTPTIPAPVPGVVRPTAPSATATDPAAGSSIAAAPVQPVRQALAVSPSSPEGTPSASISLPSAKPAISSESSNVNKVNAADPSMPSAASNAPVASATRMNAVESGTGQPVPVQTDAPKAGAETGGSVASMATAPGATHRVTPDLAASVAGVTRGAGTSDLLKAPEVASAKSNATPIATGEPNASVGGDKLTPGLTKQETSTGELAGGASRPDASSSATPAAASASEPGATSLASRQPTTRPSTAIASADLGVRLPAAKPDDSPVAPNGQLALSAMKPAAGPISQQTAPDAVTNLAGSPAASRLASNADATGGADAPTSLIAVAPKASQAAAGSSLADSIAQGTPRAPVTPSITGPAVGPAPSAAAMVASDIQVTQKNPAFSPLADRSAPSSFPTPSLASPTMTDRVATTSNTPGPESILSAVPAAPKTSSPPGSSLASAAVVAPRSAAPAIDLPKPTVTGVEAGPALAGVDGTRIGLPKIGTSPMPGDNQGNTAGMTALPGGSTDGGPIASKASGAGNAAERPVLLALAVMPGVDLTPGGRAVVDAPISGPRPAVDFVPGIAVGPSVTVAPPKIGAPESLFQRSVEQRRPLIEKLGGTAESENAVDRGLDWLARHQEPDGHWSMVTESGKKSKKSKVFEHDMALTGLATLAFLAADHSPARDGPYRQTVAAAVDWMVSKQAENGDLRGRPEHRGSGSARANMYDHGIATMAVAEAALMTGDPRYVAAAMKAAEFICEAQNKKNGGWRYTPGESGDTSVFGWQIMALHNCEQLGFETPPEVRERAAKFLTLVSSGRGKLLAGYTPGEGPTPAMTAEALFCRVLLGQPLEGESVREVSEFLTQSSPRSKGVDLYYWYYASLSLSQMQGNPQVREIWDAWNKKCRDTLIETQAKEGDAAGSWTDSRWGSHAGRVFSTALATLTLEVYYRYLPLAPGDTDAARAAWKANEPAKPPAVKPQQPKKPKFDAN